MKKYALVLGGSTRITRPIHGVTRGLHACYPINMYWGVVYLLLFLFIYLSHFKLFPFCGTNLWSQGINPSLPGTRLTF